MRLSLHILAVSLASTLLRARTGTARTKAGGIGDQYSFYHTTDEIRSEAQRLAQNCPGVTVETKSQTAGGSSVDIDIVNVRKPGATPNASMYMLFGEHARELVSPESGLHFLKSLCGETSTSQHVQPTLDEVEYRIVLNGNPNSRRKVEDGEFCLRVNENGVDLNRNWDEKWEPNPDLAPQDTNPGSSPFSEPETQIFKDDVTNFKPTSFLTIHSGTFGMYMPWAFDMEHLASRNEPQMMNILRRLDDEYCQCPFGAAGREVGYSCPGTCLDYVYDKLKTPYAFAFEIYAGEAFTGELKERWQEKTQEMDAERAEEQTKPSKMALATDGDSVSSVPQLAHEDFMDLFKNHPSDFVQLAAHHSSGKLVRREKMLREQRSCFEQFNPPTQQDLDASNDNWSKVYADLARSIARGGEAVVTA